MARKAKKTKARRTAVRKATLAPTAGPVGTTCASGLLADMKAYHQQLAGEITGIQAKMAAVATAIQTMSGAVCTAGPATKPVPGRRGPRPTGTSLKDFISSVLSSSPEPMAVKDLSTGVVRAGYETKSKNLGNQISMALMQMNRKKQVKKVARGLYQV